MALNAKGCACGQYLTRGGRGVRGEGQRQVNDETESVHACLCMFVCVGACVYACMCGWVFCVPGGGGAHLGRGSQLSGCACADLTGGLLGGDLLHHVANVVDVGVHIELALASVVVHVTDLAKDRPFCPALRTKTRPWTCG